MADWVRAEAEGRALGSVEPTGGETAADIASLPELAPTNLIGEGWPADLTRRLRVLLHTSPLDGLRRSDAIRDAEFRHYDSLALALRVLDVVIDRLGLEAEADREVVTRILRPVLSAMDAAAGVDPSPKRHERMLDKLLGGLRNDGDARRPFREEYTSLSGEGESTLR